MLYKKLGNTGRDVSIIGFGGATAGLLNYTGKFDPRNKEDRDSVIAAMQRAYELGVNYFDTAAGYGDGASEQIFGMGLEGVDPESIFLATKGKVDTGDNFRRSVENSLQYLKRDYIDLIQIHGSHHTEETISMMYEGGMLEAMRKLKEEGLVRHLGFSCECQNETLYKMIACPDFDVMQMQYNVMFQHPYDPAFQCGSLYTAKERGLGIVVMRTLTSGLFQEWIRLVNPENTFNYNPALIQFVLSNPLVDVALLGMRSVEMVEENVRVACDTSGRIDLTKLHNRYV